MLINIWVISIEILLLNIECFFLNIILHLLVLNCFENISGLTFLFLQIAKINFLTILVLTTSSCLYAIFSSLFSFSKISSLKSQFY